MEEFKTGQHIIDFTGEEWVFDYYVGNNKVFVHKPNTKESETGRTFYKNVFK